MVARVTGPTPAGGVLDDNFPDPSFSALGEAAITGLADVLVDAEAALRSAGDALAAQKSANLSDLASAVTARTNLGLGSAATQPTTAFDAAGAAAAAQAASQPVDSDLSAIAALSTTAYGRAFLALTDAPAGRTALGLGTAATQNVGAFDAAGAAAAAQAASQPVDSDLTAIAALSTTAYGRSLLALADAAAGRAALSAAADTVDAAAGTGSLRTLGTGAQQAAAGNDARLSDQRVPTDASVTTAKLAAGAVTAAKVAADVATQAELDAVGAAKADVPAAPRAVTANTTMAATDSLIRADATSGGITITLPGAPSPGGLYAIVKTDASVNTVTVAPGAGVLNGTNVLAAQYQIGLFVFDGVNWESVGGASSSASAFGGGGLILPVSGGSIAPLAFSLGADVWSANGLMRAAPIYLPRAVTATGLGVEVTTGGGAGAVMRFGIYNALAGNGYPSTLLVDGGTAVATGTGVVSVTISQALSPGIYWIVAVPQGAPSPLPALRYIATAYPLATPGDYTSGAGASTIARCFKVSGVTGALPASPTWSGDLNAPFTQMLVA